MKVLCCWQSLNNKYLSRNQEAIYSGSSRCLSRIGQKNGRAKKFVGKKMGRQKDGTADRVNPIIDPDVNAFIFLPSNFFAQIANRPMDRQKKGRKKCEPKKGGKSEW